jgi:hypothetical protein
VIGTCFGVVVGDGRAGDFELLSGSSRRSSTSASAGEITTDSSPAATRPAALARLRTPSCSPICVAATVNVKEVACSRPAITERERPSSRTYTSAGSPRAR